MYAIFNANRYSYYFTLILSLCITRVHYIPIVVKGCGKRKARKNWSMVISEKGSTRYWNYIEDYWPSAGWLSAVNAIGTRLRDLINSGLTRWRLAAYVDTVAESGRNDTCKHRNQPEPEY